MIQTYPRRLGLLLILLLLSACSGGPAPTAVPSQTPAPSPTSDPLLGLGEAGEAWQLLARRGLDIWPGWGAALPPLLVSIGADDFLAGHPAPPQDFGPAAGLVLNGQQVYRRSGHVLPVPAATAWQVAGVWVVAVPGRAEFQQAVDQALGKGKITLDPQNYIQAILHEAFHAFQLTLTGGKPPTFGGNVDEQAVLQDLAARSGLGERYTAEGQALANALRATTQPDLLQETARFLQLRRERRASLPVDYGAYEQAVEWMEGLARYADTGLLRLAGSSAYQPSLAGFNYAASDATWAQFLADLADPTSSPDGFRGRYYLLGAGQAFLLDRLGTDWKASALPGKQSLEVLLEQASIP